MSAAAILAALALLAGCAAFAGLIHHNKLLARLEAQRERDAAYRHAMRKMGRA